MATAITPKDISNDAAQVAVPGLKVRYNNDGTLHSVIVFSEIQDSNGDAVATESFVIQAENLPASFVNDFNSMNTKAVTYAINNSEYNLTAA